ncbi:MAG: DedA family protein [Candidatus Latescibacterota bacterium]|nr:DedA family protein [Candidatus Latescibacterota bacterium]
MGSKLFDWPEALLELDPIWIYASLFFSALFENLIPPIPGDTVVIFSAYLVASERLILWPVLIATVVGGEVGFMIMYFLGLKYGREVFSTRLFSYVSEEKLVKAELWIVRYGGLLVAANRFLPGVRSIISVCSGIAKLNWLYVAVCGLFSLLIWNGLLFYFGFMLGTNWSLLVEIVNSYSKIILVLICIFVVVLFWRMRAKS